MLIPGEDFLMRLSPRRRSGLTLVSAGAVVSASSLCIAQPILVQWAEPLSGRWGDGSNWTGGVSPINTATQQYAAAVGAAGPDYTVAIEGLASPMTVNSMVIDASSATVEQLPANDVTILGELDIRRGTYRMGDGNDTRLRLTLGSLSVSTDGLFTVAGSHVVSVLPSCLLTAPQIIGDITLNEQRARLAILGDVALNGSVRLTGGGTVLELRGPQEVTGGRITNLLGEVVVGSSSLGEATTLSASTVVECASGRIRRGPLLNHGLIHAVSASSVEIDLAAQPGRMAFVNHGVVEVGAGAFLVIFPEFLGTAPTRRWANPGTIRTAGELQIGGILRPDDFGIVHRVGEGQIRLKCAIDNAGAVFAVPPELDGALVEGFYVSGGVLDFSSGARLDLAFGSASPLASPLLILDGTTVAGVMNLSGDHGRVEARNGLAVQGLIDLTDSRVDLVFSGDQALSDGAIRLRRPPMQAGPQLQVTDQSTLTIGSSARVEGSGRIGFPLRFQSDVSSLMIEGTVLANDPVGPMEVLPLRGTLTNHGQMRADGGAIVIGHANWPLNYAQGGTVEAVSGGHIQFVSRVRFLGGSTLEGIWRVSGPSTIDTNESFQRLNGELHISGPEAAFSSVARLARNDGLLSVRGGASLDVGPLVNAGVVILDSRSTINGDLLAPSASGVLEYVVETGEHGGGFVSRDPAQLDGTLRVVVAPSAVVQPGDRFVIVSGPLQGEFAATDVSAPPAGLIFMIQTSGKEVALVVERELPCDWIIDGIVDVSDLQAFIQLWQERDQKADINHDGRVNAADLQAFISCWVMEAGSGRGRRK